MKTTVYADVLFLVNFSMDFITLWFSALLTSRQRSAMRMSLGAAVGALYGVISVLLSISGIFTYVFSALCCVLMSLLAFGHGGNIISLLKQSTIVWGCGALLGGMMTALLSFFEGSYSEVHNSAGPLTIFAAVSVIAVYLTIRTINSKRFKKEVTVDVAWNGQKISFSALCDSGNLMRDPISGDCVIPLSDELVALLCGKELTASMLSIDTTSLAYAKLDIRIIPHKTECSQGIICGFVPDSVTISLDNKINKVRCIVAPRKCAKDYFAGHAATIPTCLLP